MEALVGYAYFIMAVGIILLWATLAIMFMSMWISSRIESKKFFDAAQVSLKLTGLDESAKSITNDFEVYRNHRFGFKSKTIIELCQEFEHKLKLKKDEKYISKLEDIISLFKDEYRFDDEKMNDVINNVRDKSGKEDARTIREYLIRVNAFNNGIVYEKDRYLKDIQEKMERRKWFNRLCGAFGIIGSIASIYSIFR